MYSPVCGHFPESNLNKCVFMNLFLVYRYLYQEAPEVKCEINLGEDKLVFFTVNDTHKRNNTILYFGPPVKYILYNKI